MSTDLIAFLNARLDEDEALIRRNSDGRGLCDGFPDYRTYKDGDTKAADEYIEHFGPARTLREVEAGRLLVGQYERLLQARDAHDEALAEWKADVEQEFRTGMWAGAGDPGTRSRALGREADYLNAMQPVLRGLVAAKAAVYNDDPDYRQEWGNG